MEGEENKEKIKRKSRNIMRKKQKEKVEITYKYNRENAQ